MEIDAMTAEKRTFLMKQGLCFKCEEWGHLARDCKCYNFSYFVLFTYVFSLFLEVSHGAAALTHFSLTHIATTLLTHSTATLV